MTDPVAARPALWGGLECSVVRLGDQFRNQFEETGHLQSPADIEAVASLGITALHYPVLWEMVSPDSPDRHDWSFADARLARIRERGMRPIAGLVHHGSGPRYTSLADRQFPQLRLTALGRALKQIAASGGVDHPDLDQRGWWRAPRGVVRHQQPWRQEPGAGRCGAVAGLHDLLLRACLR